MTRGTIGRCVTSIICDIRNFRSVFRYQNSFPVRVIGITLALQRKYTQTGSYSVRLSPRISLEAAKIGGQRLNFGVESD